MNVEITHLPLMIYDTKKKTWIFFKMIKSHVSFSFEEPP